MQKIKFVTLLTLGLFFGIVSTVKAVSILSIQSLPGYVNTNNFKLSCTTDGNTAQFYYSKNGGSYTAFGGSIDLSTSSCLVTVDSSIVNDQTNYSFKVNVDGTDSSVTSTFYDISGPSPVSGYYKERINDGEYKIHWKNPGDSDFDKVVIYRGDAAGFSADAGHEVARVSGGANSDMTYDDHFTPDVNKTYFYLIRALDHAGNSSSLVGDGGTTTSGDTVTGTPKPGTGKVTILPKEQGSVLGTETKVSPSPSPYLSNQPYPTDNGTQGFNLFTWIFGHKKISLGVALVLVIIGYLIFKKKSK